MAWPADSPMVFNAVREHLAVDLDFDWLDGNVFGLLVDSGAGALWTPDPDDDFVGNVLAAGAVETSGTRTALVTPTAGLSVTDNCVYYDSDPLVYPGVLAAEDFDTLVLFRFVVDDTDSYLITAHYLDPQTGDGVGDVTVTPDTRGWLKW